MKRSILAIALLFIKVISIVTAIAVILTASLLFLHLLNII